MCDLHHIHCDYTSHALHCIPCIAFGKELSICFIPRMYRRLIHTHTFFFIFLGYQFCYIFSKIIFTHFNEDDIIHSSLYMTSKELCALDPAVKTSDMPAGFLDDTSEKKSHIPLKYFTVLTLSSSVASSSHTKMVRGCC